MLLLLIFRINYICIFIHCIQKFVHFFWGSLSIIIKTYNYIPRNIVKSRKQSGMLSEIFSKINSFYIIPFFA